MRKNVLLARVLLLLAGLAMTGVGRAAEIVVRLERTVGGSWVAWIPHQPTGIWAIQASNKSLDPDAWFYPPSQVDDGQRLQAVVPNVTSSMFFRARRVR